MYVLVGLFACGSVIAFAGQLKAGVHRPVKTHKAHAQGCDSLSCAQVGDNVSLVLKGHISQISEPQPGVRCVQVQEKTHAGDYCAVVK